MAADTDTPTPAESAHEDGAGLTPERALEELVVFAAMENAQFAIDREAIIKPALARPSAQDAGGEARPSAEFVRFMARGEPARPVGSHAWSWAVSSWATAELSGLHRDQAAHPRRAPTDDGAGVTKVWAQPWYQAADEAYAAAMREDVNDRMSALSRAVDAAFAARQGGAPTAEGLGAERLLDIIRYVARNQLLGNQLNGGPAPTLTLDAVDAMAEDIRDDILKAARTPPPEVAAAPGLGGAAALREAKAAPPAVPTRKREPLIEPEDGCWYGVNRCTLPHCDCAQRNAERAAVPTPAGEEE